MPSALGYSEQSGIPFELGIIRNQYIGRTFIEPTEHIRHLGVKLKHSANRPILKGKRVILVDDLIVRGTTSKKIVEMVRAAGAREVHMRISSPPTTHSCFYGIDTPERSQLLAAQPRRRADGRTDRRRQPRVHSIDGLYRALGKPGRDPEKPFYCDACFTGDYPIALPDQADNADRQLSLLAEIHNARRMLVRPRGADHRRQPGLGAAVAVELARLGAQVVITARTQGGLEETDDAVRAVGGVRDTAAAGSARAGKDRGGRPQYLRPVRPAGYSGARGGVLGKLTPVSHAARGPHRGAGGEHSGGVAADPKLRGPAAACPTPDGRCS